MSLIAQKLISASGATGEAVDDDFNLVTGLYHFDGSNGAQNNTFLDSSDSGHTLTRNGDTTQGTFSPFSADEGKWSVDGASGASWVDVTNTSGDFQWGTGAFTIEGFVFIAIDTFGPYLYGERPTSTNGRYVSLAFDGDGKIGWSGDGTWQLRSASDVKTDRLGKWTHFAYVRNSTATNQSFIYWNGSLVATGTINVDYNLATRARLGGLDYSDSSNNYGAYFSNYRLIKGTALYSGSTITVPTAPLTNITNTKLLTLQSNRFIDNSNNSNNSFTGNGSTTSIQPFSPFAPSAAYDSTVNGGSGYFDGSGDYLRLPTSNDFDFAGSFTIEAWVYLEDLSTSRTILATCGNIGGRGGLYFGTNGNNLIFFQFITNTTLITSSSSIIKHQWNHVAAVRNGSVITLYINGTSVGTSTFANGFTGNSANGGIGDYYENGGYGFSGYMSDMRVVNGTAVYTSAFTPPTAPLTKVTNTKLLLNFTNASIIDQTGKTNIKTGGNAQLDTSVKKFGTASYEGDGSPSSFLTLSNAKLIPQGTQSFTVECFIYINSPHKNYNNIYSGAFGLQMYVDSGGKLICWLGNSSGSYFVNGLQSTATISLSTWTHIALVRDFSAETVTWFVNGTAGGQATSVTDSVVPVGLYQSNATIGAYPTGAYLYDGFLDELRITNKARYTSNFTAPTKEFPNL